jgi:hypothetical protein
MAIIERYDPKWLDNATEGLLGSSAGVDTFLDRVIRRETYIEMTVRYTSGEDVWTQSFVAERLTENTIEAALQEGGLRFERWLDDRQTWFVASPSIL